MMRLRKALKWTGIILGGLVAIGLIANAVFIWATDTRLERQLAAIRAAGDPLSLPELARPSIPPEKNAATYLRRAEAGIAAIEKELAGLQPVSERPGSLMPPEEQEAVEEAFRAYPDMIPLLERAAACPDCSAELDFTLPPNEFLAESLDVVQKPRAAARVLGYRAALLVAQGKHNEAVQSALLMFRLARHFDRNPILVGYLVALAVRDNAVQTANYAIQTGPISEEVRRALETELATQERMEGFAPALKSERAFVISSMETMPARKFWLLARGHWNRQESACLDLFPPLIDLAEKPGLYREMDQTTAGTKPVLAELLYPAIKAAYAAVVRTRARIRALRVLSALQGHIPADSDETPQLSELGLPVETTTDPYNGEPMHISKTPQGWLVYSVGPNLRDDGGDLHKSATGDVGVGPAPPMSETDRNEEKKVPVAE